MPILTEREKKQELERISAFLNEMEIAADVMNGGGFFDETCMLIGLPTEETLEWNEGEPIPEDVHMAAGYVVQMDPESEQQLTKYLLLYALVPVELSGVDEGAVLRLINDINRQIMLGAFFYGETKDIQGLNQGARVQFRHIIGVSTDDTWDVGVVCEAVLEIGVYYDLMKEKLQELKDRS